MLTSTALAAADDAVDFGRPVLHPRRIRQAPHVAGGRYGETRRPNWPLIAAIIGLHLSALVLMTMFDVVPLRHARRAMEVVLVPAEIVPPPPVATAPASERTPPPDAPPPPPQMVVTSAATPDAPVLMVPPPAPPPPVLAVAAPVATPGPAPIVPPDGSAATLRNPPPTYPMESRRRHEQGTVRLRVLISVEGQVREISIAKSSGYERLDHAALETVRKWRFQPGTQAGVPVEAYGSLAIPFTLT